MPSLKNMKVLVDANVVLDALLGREPFFTHSDQVLNLCDDRVEGYIAAHSITNIFFILQKTYDVASCRRMILRLLSIFTVEYIDAERINAAVNNVGFDDFEDSLQHECALAAQVDFIITRNAKDFAGSVIPCLTPDTFCGMYS